MGSGGLVINGGIEILTGTNTYTGGTTINSGELELGNATPGGSITGSVADNGVLAFGGTGTTVFSGVISGTGAVVQAEPALPFSPLPIPIPAAPPSTAARCKSAMAVTAACFPAMSRTTAPWPLPAPMLSVMVGPYPALAASPCPAAL